MDVDPLEPADVAALARASGLEAGPARVAALTATLPIVNDIRARVWARAEGPAGEPALTFAAGEAGA